MKLQTRIVASAVTAAIATIASPSAEAGQRSTVDTAIVLAVENSIYVTAVERAAQISAHVAALKSPAFVDRALSNDRCLGLHYLEWSGDGRAQTIPPWMVICSADKAREAAGMIEAATAKAEIPASNASASPVDAIDLAHEAMRTMPFAARKKIINVSTVYADEDGQPPRSTKNRYEREDYTINAVAFAPDGGDMTDAATDYLKQHVVAGNGAFAAASPGISTYPTLVLQSMLLAAGERGGRRSTF